MDYEMAVLTCGVRIGPHQDDNVHISIERAFDHIYDMHKNHTLLNVLKGTADEFKEAHAYLTPYADIHLFLGHLFKAVPQLTSAALWAAITNMWDEELGLYDLRSCDELICQYGDAFLTEHGRIQNEHDTKAVDLAAAPDAAADAAVAAYGACVHAEGAAFMAQEYVDGMLYRQALARAAAIELAAAAAAENAAFFGALAVHEEQNRYATAAFNARWPGHDNI
jgi:hypothetical protein